MCYVLFAIGHGFLCSALKKKAEIKSPLFSVHKIMALSIFMLLYTALINIMYKYPMVRVSLAGICILVILIKHKKVFAFVQGIIKK